VSPIPTPDAVYGTTRRQSLFLSAIRSLSREIEFAWFARSDAIEALGPLAPQRSGVVQRVGAAGPPLADPRAGPAPQVLVDGLRRRGAVCVGAGGLPPCGWPRPGGQGGGRPGQTPGPGVRVAADGDGRADAHGREACTAVLRPRRHRAQEADPHHKGTAARAGQAALRGPRPDAAAGRAAGCRDGGCDLRVLGGGPALPRTDRDGPRRGRRAERAAGPPAGAAVPGPDDPLPWHLRLWTQLRCGPPAGDAHLSTDPAAGVGGPADRRRQPSRADRKLPVGAARGDVHRLRPRPRRAVCRQPGRHLSDHRGQRHPAEAGGGRRLWAPDGVHPARRRGPRVRGWTRDHAPRRLQGGLRACRFPHPGPLPEEEGAGFSGSVC